MGCMVSKPTVEADASDLLAAMDPPASLNAKSARLLGLSTDLPTEDRPPVVTARRSKVRAPLES